MSWWEFRCWLQHLGETSALVRQLRRRAEDKTAEDKTIGQRGDALPIEEMDAWLGWDHEEVS